MFSYGLIAIAHGKLKSTCNIHVLKESLNRVFHIYLLILLSLAEMDERFREMDAEWEEFQEFKEFHRQKELHGRTSVIEKPRNRMDNAEGKKATLQHNEICFTQ